MGTWALQLHGGMGANTSPPACIWGRAQLTHPTGEPQTGLPCGSTVPTQPNPEAPSARAVCPRNTKQEATQRFTRMGNFAVDRAAAGQLWGQC